MHACAHAWMHAYMYYILMKCIRKYALIRFLLNGFYFRKKINLELKRNE